MEVTDLKGLKRLMKGDVSNKFEFVEEEADNGFDDHMFGFSHNGGGGKMDNPGATYNTYQNSANPRSIADSKKYRDLSSDDSELMDQDNDNQKANTKAYEDDYDGMNYEDMMYEAPTN